MAFKYDLAILGAGPGGYVGAIRAAQLGLSVCVIEKDKAGGVCLNMGCIPSKAYIHQAEIFSSIGKLQQLGVSVDLGGFDYAKVQAETRKAADTLSKGVEFLLKKNKVQLVQGEGVITGAHEITVDGEQKISADKILIATGSSPKEIPGFEVDGKSIMNSDDILMRTDLPKSLIILGAGAIGCEFAHIMNSFGVEVQLVEMLDHILPAEDEETAKVLARSFKKRKIKMYTGTKASAPRKEGDKVLLDIENKKGAQTIEAESLLVVVGRGPNTANIGLENVGISTERGFIPVGDYYRTSVESIYAVGDVVASPLLAHVASKEAEIAVEYMAGQAKAARLDPTLIPTGVYTEPEVAGFGYTEDSAKEAGFEAAASVFPIRGAGKSVAVEKPEGQVKIVYDANTKEILGGRIVGTQATDLIHELLLARSSELLPEDIAEMIHAHPTLSEAIMEAAKGVDGAPIHA
ncbi:MAG TPA: dihydrolipoyl dehydrogenase [Sediminispirochaeta sp.]|nr:dihydrolipoyl dehydrogenase [Sediminispirochaeta sp.]